MTKRTMKMLMGNEAIAFGALRSGVNVVAGYPGTPSTEVLETVAKNNPGSVHVEWSTNEKAALEVAAGASYCGARTLVTMKQVGMNVASDPLMSLSYIGVKGGMVVLVADDPGPISSQTEQDTRVYGKFAKIPVFDPTTPEEAYLMMEDAYRVSEEYNTPVIMRPTTRICHARAPIDLSFSYQPHEMEGFVRDSRWIIFPPRSYKGHLEMNVGTVKLAREFSGYPFNTVIEHDASNGSEEALENLYEGSEAVVSGLSPESPVHTGIMAGGVSDSYVKEALASPEFEKMSYRMATCATPYPFPEQFALAFLKGLERVIVFEELDPVIEEELTYLCGVHHLDIEIHGKHTHETNEAGENTCDAVRGQLDAFFGIAQREEHDEGREGIADKAGLPVPELAARPPVLCAGCPHRGSFYAVKKALKGQRAYYMGDIGCYTLGNAAPLDMVDTCLCMGAGITIAQGMQVVDPDAKHIAFVGDSTFFASAITGIINAYYNKIDITVIVLDNSTTAMTGHQPHPGTGVLMTGSEEETRPGPAARDHAIAIDSILGAIGVDPVITVDPLDLESSMAAVAQAVDAPRVSAVIFKSPCIALGKPTEPFEVDEDACTNCRSCIREIGCPALTLRTETDDSKQVVIDPTLCFGCGLCAQVCPFHAIGVKEEDER